MGMLIVTSTRVTKASVLRVPCELYGALQDGILIEKMCHLVPCCMVARVYTNASEAHRTGLIVRYSSALFHYGDG